MVTKTHQSIKKTIHGGQLSNRREEENHISCAECNIKEDKIIDLATERNWCSTGKSRGGHKIRITGSYIPEGTCNIDHIRSVNSFVHYLQDESRMRYVVLLSLLTYRAGANPGFCFMKCPVTGFNHSF